MVYGSREGLKIPLRYITSDYVTLETYVISKEIFLNLV